MPRSGCPGPAFGWARAWAARVWAEWGRAESERARRARAAMYLPVWQEQYAVVEGQLSGLASRPAKGRLACRCRSDTGHTAA